MVANKLNKPLPHTLLYGMPGLGKTTLAEIIAQEMGSSFISLEGISLDSKESILSVVTGIQRGTIVFIDEIHRMNNKMSEIWYKIMENYSIDEITETQVNAINIPEFTTIGATTDFGMLLKPFRDRFIHLYELEPYTINELTLIIRKLIMIHRKTAYRVASISQYTPRIAKNYVKAMHEYAILDNRHYATKMDFDKLLELKQLTQEGLTKAQLRVLKTLANSGTRLGKLSLAMASRVAEIDLEELVEPYLVIEGYIIRTPRGRTITEKGLRVLQNRE